MRNDFDHDQPDEHRARREGAEHYDLLLKSWAQAFWEADADGVVVTDSPSWRAYTGQTVEAWLGYGWLDAIHPDDRAYAERQWREAIAARALVNAEFRLHAPDGGWRWTNVRAAPVLDAKGGIEKWVGMNIDIDARIRAEAALRASEEKYRTIFDSIDEGFCIIEVIFDADGKPFDLLHVEANAAYERYTGLKGIVGKRAQEIVPEGGDWVDFYGRVALTGEAARLEIHMPPGVDRWISSYASRIGGADSRRVAVVFNDVTERKRAEQALRASEERFREFGRASSDGLWIRDAATLALEYASAAMATIHGLPIAEMTADPMALPALIVPEDRGETLGYLDRVRAGESVVHEFRIQRPSDGRFRWIRNVGFPLFGSDGAVVRIAGIASDVTEAKLAAEHQGILLAELQHRVRNIMAIIRSIVVRTADGAASVDDYAELLSGRLLTLARVQALLTRAANAGVGLATIVADELGALATHAGQFTIEGLDVELSPKAAETMTLAVHELTTNALKYGALSVAAGRVEVRWSIERRGETSWLVFDWAERGGPAPARPSGQRRRGFGSELIEGRVPYELGGSGAVRIEPGGVRCHIAFPLRGGASILETDAPPLTTVFGGALDMTGEPVLTGQRILVVEDEYYLATDAARALRGAGAEILGPFATEESARSGVGEAPPTSAVLDINLRGGRSFDLARELVARGVPILFVTGYDQEVIPVEFAAIKRLQKPVEFRTIVRELAALLRPDHLARAAPMVPGAFPDG